MRIQRGMTTSKYGLGRLAIILSQWAEDDRPIKGQEIARLGQSATKSLSGLWRPITISLSANAQKIQKRDGQQSRQTWSILCPPPTLLTWDNKRNGICHYTLGCLDHYPCRRLRLWNSLWCSLGIYVCVGLWSSLGRHCYHLLVVYLL